MHRQAVQASLHVRDGLTLVHCLGQSVVLDDRVVHKEDIAYYFTDYLRGSSLLESGNMRHRKRISLEYTYQT